MQEKTERCSGMKGVLGLKNQMSKRDYHITEKYPIQRAIKLSKCSKK